MTKTVVSGIDADKDVAFEFTVTLNDTTITKAYPIVKTGADTGSSEDASTSEGADAGEETEASQETIQFTGGEATFSLKHGESLTITGLPTDVEYTVTEAENDNFTTEKTGDTGTISNTLATAAFTNTRNQQFVSIWKTDLGYNTLTGASFVLYAKDDYDAHGTDASPKMSGTVGSDGILNLGSLAVGTYSLVETQAPAGYLLLDMAITITVTADDVKAMQGMDPAEVERKGDEHWADGQHEATWQIRVWNNPGAVLPMTGGSGTLPYTLGGIGLIMASALMYIFGMRRRERRLK